MAILFYNLTPVTLKNRKKLKLFISSLFKDEGKTLESLNVIFCTDEYLLTINKQHLNHNFYTDIITFDMSEPYTSPIIGELYISVERVNDNSSILKVSVVEELHRVIFHGILHLCGYQDKTPNQTKLMRVKEAEYLQKYFSL